jgi:hypothetical protein
MVILRLAAQKKRASVVISGVDKRNEFESAG